MKKIFLDVETTGTEPKVHAIIQIAGIIEINGRTVDQFNWKLKPPMGALIEDKALEVNGISRAALADFPDQGEVFSSFLYMLDQHVDRFSKSDKFFLYAYNAPFDTEFMRAWFNRNASKYFGSYFHFPSIDVAVLAGEKLQHVRGSMFNFKLATVAQHVGLDTAGALHDAMFDVQLTYDLYNRLGEMK